MSESPSTTQEAPVTNSGSHGVMSRTFVGLLVMQFMTATNDNVFRWLAVGIGKQYVRHSHVSYILTAGMIAFVLPYLLLAAPSGYLADRFSKRRVIVACKVAEILLMILGVIAIGIGSLWLLFLTLAMMGAQACLFSPAKLGSIPETLRAESISAANGLMGLTTVVATVVGSAIGNWLTDATVPKGQSRLWLSASVLIGIAAIGWAFSLLVSRTGPADPLRPFPWNAIRESIRDLKVLAAQRAMLRVALGTMFFWSLGSLAHMNIDQFVFEGKADETTRVAQAQVAPLLACLAIGVGVGSVLAGVWSGGRVELGILPLGAAIIAFSSMFLFLVQGALISPDSAPTFAYVCAAVLLLFLGVGAGLFDVPLTSYLQHRSPPESRGAILSACNFMTFAGILLFSLLFCGLRAPLRPGGEPLMTARQVFLFCGLITVPVCIYIVWLIPQASLRFLMWLASKTVYRIRVYGHENLPHVGGALLVPNHVSYLDAVLLLLTSSRPIRVVAWAGNFENWLMRAIGKLFDVILVHPSKPKSVIHALREANQAVAGGELVCIFPEGGITRTGQVLGFRPGLLRIVQGTTAPVIPVFLDELWGSIFSFERGKFFWKWPKRWPYPISIYFGKPLPTPEDVHSVRQAVMELGVHAVQQRSQRNPQLMQDLVRQCKRRKYRWKVADSMGSELSGGNLLMRALTLRRLLRRHVLDGDEQIVGILLPPSAGAVVTNVALALDRRISANLNYTNSSGILNDCIAQAGIRHVLTSRKFMEKLDYQLHAELVYVEEFKDKVTWWDKLSVACSALVTPTNRLIRSLGLNQIEGDDVLTVIFTSGSTGKPKGVMLTHTNIASNVVAIDQVVRLRSGDVLIGVLPFFHSFGYTVTMWGVLGLDIAGVYHFNPLDAKQIGKICAQYGGTVLLATPTFLRHYSRRCDKEELKTLDVVVAGAEKLPLDLCDAFQQKFGVRPVEGYGTTELSPLVSVNVPPSRSAKIHVDSKEGTVGRPIPGVTAQITDVETGGALPANQAGMLWIKGPNVMKGYLGQPDLTAEVVKDGWYQTGDIALIDDDGFITITGRQSRFSKIGGEMVPHVRVEEEINRLLGAADEGTLKAAVTAIADPKKGERLIVVHLPMEKTPQEIGQRLSQGGLPNLYIPASDSYLQVDQLPILGSGKLDLKAIKDLAEKHFA